MELANRLLLASLLLIIIIIIDSTVLHSIVKGKGS